MSGQSEYVAYTHQAYLDAVEHTAQRLRDAADRLVQEALDISGQTYIDVGPYSRAAANAVKELHWGIANADTGRMLQAAATADRNLPEDD